MMLTPAMKSKLFGKTRRWEVGGLGRLENSALPSGKKARLSDQPEHEEPAFVHTPCFKFFDDEVVTSGASAIMDFTPGAGYLLWAAVLRGVPAVGVCMSEVHREVVYNHLLGLCLQAMADEGVDLHDPRFIETLGQHGETAAAAAIAKAVAKAKAKASAAGKAKGKSKGKGRGKGKRNSSATEPELTEGTRSLRSWTR